MALGPALPWGQWAGKGLLAAVLVSAAAQLVQPSSALEQRGSKEAKEQWKAAAESHIALLVSRHNRCQSEGIDTDVCRRTESQYAKLAPLQAWAKKQAGWERLLEASELYHDAYHLLLMEQYIEAYEAAQESAALQIFPHRTAERQRKWHARLFSRSNLFKHQRGKLADTFILMCGCMMEIGYVLQDLQMLLRAHVALEAAYVLVHVDEGDGAGGGSHLETINMMHGEIFGIVHELLDYTSSEKLRHFVDALGADCSGCINDFDHHRAIVSLFEAGVLHPEAPGGRHGEGEESEIERKCRALQEGRLSGIGDDEGDIGELYNTCAELGEQGEGEGAGDAVEGVGDGVNWVARRLSYIVMQAGGGLISNDTLSKVQPTCFVWNQERSQCASYFAEELGPLPDGPSIMGEEEAYLTVPDLLEAHSLKMAEGLSSSDMQSVSQALSDALREMDAEEHPLFALAGGALGAKEGDGGAGRKGASAGGGGFGGPRVGGTAADAHVSGQRRADPSSDPLASRLHQASDQFRHLQTELESTTQAATSHERDDPIIPLTLLALAMSSLGFWVTWKNRKYLVRQYSNRFENKHRERRRAASEDTEILRSAMLEGDIDELQSAVERLNADPSMLKRARAQLAVLKKHKKETDLARSKAKLARQRASAIKREEKVKRSNSDPISTSLAIAAVRANLERQRQPPSSDESGSDQSADTQGGWPAPQELEFTPVGPSGSKALRRRHTGGAGENGKDQTRGEQAEVVQLVQVPAPSVRSRASSSLSSSEGQQSSLGGRKGSGGNAAAKGARRGHHGKAVGHHGAKGASNAGQGRGKPYGQDRRRNNSASSGQAKVGAQGAPHKPGQGSDRHHAGERKASLRADPSKGLVRAIGNGLAGWYATSSRPNAPAQASPGLTVAMQRPIKSFGQGGKARGARANDARSSQVRSGAPLSNAAPPALKGRAGDSRVPAGGAGEGRYRGESLFSDGLYENVILGSPKAQSGGLDLWAEGGKAPGPMHPNANTPGGSSVPGYQQFGSGAGTGVFHRMESSSSSSQSEQGSQRLNGLGQGREAPGSGANGGSFLSGLDWATNLGPTPTTSWTSTAPQQTARQPNGAEAAGQAAAGGSWHPLLAQSQQGGESDWLPSRLVESLAEYANNIST